MRTRGLIAALLIGASSAVFAIAWPGPQQLASPAPVAEEDRLALYEESLTQLWEGWSRASFPDLERPRIRDIEELPTRERNTEMARCLGASGFAVTEYWGGIDYVPPENVDQETLLVAQFTCEARFPYEGTLESLLSVAQRSALYDYNTGFLPACLGFFGVDLDFRIPSRASFIENSVARPSWTPYTAVWIRGATQEEFAGLERHCPSEPAWRRQADLIAAVDE